MANRQRPILSQNYKFWPRPPTSAAAFCIFGSCFCRCAFKNERDLAKTWARSGARRSPTKREMPRCASAFRLFCPPSSAFSRRSFAFSLMVRQLGQKMDKFGEKTVEFSRKAAVFRAKVHRFFGAVEGYEQKRLSMCEKSALRGTKIVSDVALCRRGGEERACFCRKREQVATENLL